MGQLQNLDIHWEKDIKQLFELIVNSNMNYLKELTIREIWIKNTHLDDIASIVVMEYDIDRLCYDLEDFLLIESHKSMSNSPSDTTHVQILKGFLIASVII